MRAATIAGLCLIAGSAANAVDLHDPTRPPFAAVAPSAARAPAAPRFQLSAIFLSGDRSVAVVNAMPVRCGERVGPYRVEKITADGVSYSYAGHTAFAPLRGHSKSQGD
jgi:hypothetical protein